MGCDGLEGKNAELFGLEGSHAEVFPRENDEFIECVVPAGSGDGL